MNDYQGKRKDQIEGSYKVFIWAVALLLAWLICYGAYSLIVWGVKSIGRYPLVLLMISGCQFEFENEVIADPFFMEHYTTFINEAEIRNVNLPEKAVMIYWANDVGENSAMCRTTDRSATIRVNERLKKSPDWFVESVIFHELGHGLLGRHHMDRGVEVTPYEASLMSVPSTRAYYQQKREYYVNELFNPIKK